MTESNEVRFSNSQHMFPIEDCGMHRVVRPGPGKRKKGKGVCVNDGCNAHGKKKTVAMLPCPYTGQPLSGVIRRFSRPRHGVIMGQRN